MITLDKTPDTAARQHCLDLAGAGEDELVFFDGLDAAIVGVGEQAGQPPTVVYDRAKCLEILEDLGCEDPLEYFEHNIAGAYVGSGSPVFLTHRTDS